MKWEIFFIVFEGLSFGEKIKIVDTSFKLLLGAPEIVKTCIKGWGVEDMLFWKKKNWNFYICQEILEKTSSWKFCKIVWHPLGNFKVKTKTHGNYTWGFLEHPWKFHFLFNWPLEFPHALSPIPLWKFHFLFNWLLEFWHALLQYPWKSHVLNWIFYWNSLKSPNRGFDGY